MDINNIYKGGTPLENISRMYRGGSPDPTLLFERTPPVNWIPTDGLPGASASLAFWADPSKESWKTAALQDRLGFANADPFQARAGFYDTDQDLSYEFNGSNSYLEVDTSELDFGTGDFSIEAWIKTDDSSGNHRIISTRHQSSGSGEGWELFLNSSSGLVRFIMDDGPSIYSAVDASIDVTDGKWHQIIVTINRTTDEVKYYIDKTLDGTGDISAVTGDITPPNNPIIGARAYNYSEPFPGRIARVRAWDAVLTQAQAIELHNGYNGLKYSQLSAGLTANMVASYDLDEEPDPVGGIPATVVSRPTSITGIRGNAVRFDGIADRYELGDVMDYGRTDAFSGSGFIRLTNKNKGQAIISRRDSSTGKGWMFYVSSNNSLRFMIGAHNGNRSVAGTAIDAIDTDTWYHVAFSYDGSGTASGIKLYIDSVEDSTNILDTSTSSSNASVDAMIARQSGATPSYFDGDIDDFVITTDVISAGEVSSHDNSGVGADPTGIFDNIAHHFTMDTGQAFDAHGTNHAVISNVLQGVAGVGNNVLVFDGSDDRVSVASVASNNFGTGDFSFSLWHNSSVSTKGDIVSKRSGITGTDQGWNVAQGNGGANAVFEICDGVSDVNVVGSVTINDGAWHHLGFVKTSGNIYIYVDGVLDNSNTHSLGSVSNAIPLTIGRNGDGTRHVTASIDDLVITSDEITSGEFTSLYASGQGVNPTTILDNIVHYFDMNEDAYSASIDDQGSADIDGNLLGFHSVNQADDLSGNNDHAIQSTSVDQPNINESDFTERVIEFNGSSHNLNWTQAMLAMASDDEGGIFIAVTEEDITPASNSNFWSFGDNNGNTYITLQRQTDGKIQVHAAQSGALQFAFKTNASWGTAGEPMLIGVIHTGVEAELWINGTHITDITWSNETDKTFWLSSASGLDAARIMCRNWNSSGDASHMEGKVLAFEAWSGGDIIDADREYIEGRIAHQIDSQYSDSTIKDALPSGHTFKSNAPT